MYYKKLSLKTRRDIMILLILIFIVSITIGYALLSSNLNLTGTSTINNPTWDVHWNNVQIKSGSVEGTKVTTAANITNPTTVEFAVKLDSPGEYYEFTVDAVNSGTIDAMIGTISNKVYAANGTTEKELGSYLEYTISYDDNVALAQNQILAAGTSETYKVLLKFKDNINPNQLPSSLDQYVFKFTVDYVQKDSSGVVVSHPNRYVVSTTKMYMGSTIPAGVNARIIPELAMADWQNIEPGKVRPFYLKYTFSHYKCRIL